MDRLTKRLISIWVMGSLAAVAAPQNPFNLDGQSQSSPTATLGGTATIDIIQLRATGPGAPLRFGNVVPGSERVQLDSQVLKRGVDYTIDNAVGVVYLMRAQRAGQSLTVTYRYQAKGEPAPEKKFSGLTGFKFDLLPGNLSMVMGLGLTERAADGSVLTSNIYGVNNKFSMGQGKLSGLFLVGERQKNSTEAGLQMDASARGGQASSAEQGDSSFIVQQFRSSLMGGSVNFDYQDVSKNFAGFNSVKEAGYDDATVNRFAAERGLTRTGMSLKDLKFGGLQFSTSMRDVKDHHGGIEWRSMAMKQGGLEVNVDSRRVDAGFQRFKDIGEGDREQLMRERGMSRENLGGKFSQKVGTLSFNSSKIEDDATGKGINRREVGLDTSKLKFNLGDQEVESGFNRFDSILGQEKQAYGREAGLRRQWMGLQSSLLGAKTPLSFSQNIISGQNGSFRATDASINTSTWSLSHNVRKTDATFGRLGSMQEGEMDGHIKSIANMYGNNVATRPEERGRFLQGDGLSRSYSQVGAKPFKGWDVSLSQLNLQGRQDQGSVTSGAISSKNVNVNYRRQELGAKFNELTSMMEFERQRLGTIAGLERTDLGFDMRLGGSRTLSVQSLTARANGADLSRTTAKYSDRKVDVNLSAREVDSDFTVANQLVDGEKDILGNLRGFRERSGTIRWEILPNLKLNAAFQEALGQSTDEDRMMRNMQLDYAPDKSLQISVRRFEQKSEDPISVLFANQVDRISLVKNLGSAGTFKYLSETVDFDGKNTQSPDSRRDYLAYERRLNNQTSMRTEQTRTKFSNGDKENISANTLETTLTKNLGVSVTDTKVDRNGLDRDETKRDYGFWMNLGKALRISYGYAQQLNGESSGVASKSLTIGNNAARTNADQVGSVQDSTVGDLRLGAGYGENSWDSASADRTQAFSNVRLGTARPIQFGLLRDVNLGFSLDTAADYTKWLRENRFFSFNGRIGSNQLGYEYRGQMHQSGYRGIDRTFRFQTDNSDKRWLRMNIFYKLRTLPWDEQVMIRDYNITARPVKNLEISHQLQTNPEVARGDVILGSIAQAARINRWRVDYKQSPNLTLGGSWQELVNDQNKALTRTGGVNLQLFAKSGSPVNLFYGVEQAQGNVARRTTQRYHVQYDQRPGPNQMLSLFAGNVSYGGIIEQGLKSNNWTLRLDYQLKF